MPSQLKKYVSIKPNVMSGMPVIAGTRIPIERIYYLLKQGYSLDMLWEEYPWVDKKKIQYAVAYLVKAGMDAFEKTQKVQTAV